MSAKLEEKDNIILDLQEIVESLKTQMLYGTGIEYKV